MSKLKTYAAIILDQSSSMFPTKSQTIMGYNELVQQMKLNSKDQDIFVSLITFNGNVFEHIWCESAEKVEEANESDYNCNGATALFDAIGYTIQKMKDTTDIEDENNAYLIQIITDGENNASTKYTQEMIHDFIEPLKSKRWTFTFVGCSEQYIKELAKKTAIPVSNCAVWDNRSAASTTKAANNVACSTRNFLRSRVANANSRTYKTECYYSADSASCADFTDDSINTQPYVPLVNTQPYIPQTNWNDLISNVNKTFKSTTPVKL